MLADLGYDADWIRALVSQQGAWANISPKSNRKEPICFSPYLYRARNLVERFFNKIKQCRRIWLRAYEFTPYSLKIAFRGQFDEGQIVGRKFVVARGDP